MPKEEFKELLRIKELLESCKSKYRVSVKGKKTKIVDETYVNLVGDPCYSYSTKCKNEFFSNKMCSILFLLSESFITELILNGSERN